jgi:DNA mismatch repair ATPase MutS
MDIVFKEVDHTVSITGSQYLYYLLRTPVFNDKLLSERAHIINKLLKNKKTSQILQYNLQNIGEATDVSFKFLRKGLEANRKLLIIYRILGYIILPEIIIIFFYPLMGIIILTISLFINIIIHTFNKYRIFEEISEFKYFSRLINCAREIVKVDTEDIEINKEEIECLIQKLKKISRNLSFINFGTGITKTEIETFAEILSALFLIEPIIFYNTINLINKYKNELVELHTLIGRIDALIAIASYKKSLDYYSEPVLEFDSNHKKLRYYIETKNIYHPLLKEPVSNSFKLKKGGAIITGSNASGKSTFLKTVGVNTIFAQSVFFTFSEFYRSSYHKIFTSIGTTDNFIEGESYFMVEARLLKRIIEEEDKNIPVLCILDEIFRGTNTIERISAGIEVLKYFTGRNFCVIAATHDLELANFSKDFCENYHFREEIIGRDIIFSYVLHNGVCKTKNALKILKNMGYPEEIYKGAINFGKVDNQHY